MTLFSCDGTELESDIGSTFTDGSGPVNDTFCLESGLGGLIIDVSGGEFDEDAYWAMTFPSGDVKTGVAGSQEFGTCVSPFPSAAPSVTSMPTELCETYVVELQDDFGDG